jgi:glycosyltransferase involved in cell wall biosynthesis
VLDYIKRQRAHTKGDYGIHLEIPRYDEIEKNHINILIPNAEWFDPKWLANIKKFDTVFCKTFHAVEVFKKFHHNCIYTGFTSNDMFLDIEKDKRLLHIEGKSMLKNTDALISAYQMRPELPTCYAISSRNTGKLNGLEFFERLPYDKLKVLLNACLIHICPSMYEGFGHYINEARSTCAVILTTDREPMNEFITDKRFLIDGIRARNHNLVPLYKVNPIDLANKIQAVYKMDFDELIEIGKLNREKYLALDVAFKENLIKFVK